MLHYNYNEQFRQLLSERCARNRKIKTYFVTFYFAARVFILVLFVQRERDISWLWHASILLVISILKVCDAQVFKHFEYFSGTNLGTSPIFCIRWRKKKTIPNFIWNQAIPLCDTPIFCIHTVHVLANKIRLSVAVFSFSSRVRNPIKNTFTRLTYCVTKPLCSISFWLWFQPQLHTCNNFMKHFYLSVNLHVHCNRWT